MLELFKAMRDKTKLTKKIIINKKGKPQTVWVRVGEKEKPKETKDIQPLKNIDIEELKGRKIIGYRYGKAPKSEKSWNSREGKYEDGVSMAKVGHMDELKSVAVINLKNKKIKKHYYEGEIAGEGGDNKEVVMKNLKEISSDDYKNKLKDSEIVKNTNDIVDAFTGRTLKLLDRGFNVGNKADIMSWREKNIKPEPKKIKSEAPKDQTETPEFKKWFGDSKVVDKNGKPLVVYHGTQSDFKEFRGVTYFTSSKKEAEGYAKFRGNNPDKANVEAVYLAIKNPADESNLIETAKELSLFDEAQSIAELGDNPKIVEKLKEKGFDGIVGLTDYGFMSDFDDVPTVIAFSPNQIKSAAPKDQIEAPELLNLESESQYRNYINDNYIKEAQQFSEKTFANNRNGEQILYTMGEYQNFWYKDINKDLRNDAIDDITSPKIQDIDIFIDNFKIKNNITMYRGLKFDDEFNEGDVFEHKSFASFTSNSFEATQHGFEAILECNFEKGSDVAPMIYRRKNKIEANVSEQEFIAKHGMKFKVLSKTKKNNKDYYKVEVFHE